MGGSSEKYLLVNNNKVSIHSIDSRTDNHRTPVSTHTHTCLNTHARTRTHARLEKLDHALHESTNTTNGTNRNDIQKKTSNKE